MLLDLKNIVNKYNLNFKGVLHIGAHWGQEDILYDELKISNRIYFEPLSKNFKVLREKIDKKYECIKVALGNKVELVEMNVEEANNGMSSSILEPGIHLQQYPHIQFTKKEIVEMTKLDLVNFDRSNFDLINIDVQGYELEVFKGAKETLSNIKYIISEVNKTDVYINCVKVAELDEYLSTYGFRRLETNWAGLTWGDAFYAK